MPSIDVTSDLNAVIAPSNSCAGVEGGGGVGSGGGAGGCGVNAGMVFTAAVFVPALQLP